MAANQPIHAHAAPQSSPFKYRDIPGFPGYRAGTDGTIVGDCPIGMEGCHAPDNDRTNCHLSNLRWDTRANNQKDRRENNTATEGEGNGNGAGMPLAIASLSWPSPRSEDSESCGNHPGSTDSVTGVITTWASPATRDGKGGSFEKTKQGRDLATDISHWPSPQARDHKCGAASEETASESSRPLNEAVLSSLPDQTPTDKQSRSGSGRRLNPAFVCWLMGWPAWCPKKRIDLPAFVPDVTAGASAPLQLTNWKIRALRLCALLEIKGHVTDTDFRRLALDKRRWMNGSDWLQLDLNGEHYTRGRSLRFDKQHPEVFKQVLAEEREFAADTGKGIDNG